VKVIGIIPARYASTRFPGKPLIDIHGKSMIQRVFEQCQKSNLDEVWVATDDVRIEANVQAFGGNVVMTSKDIPNGSERCRIAFKEINSNADAFINIQGDEPIMSPNNINLLIDLLKKDEVQIGTLIQIEEDEDDLVNPNRVKVVIDQEQRAMLFSRSVIPFPRTKPQDLNRHIHIGIYAFKSQILDDLQKIKPTAIESLQSN